MNKLRTHLVIAALILLAVLAGGTLLLDIESPTQGPSSPPKSVSVASDTINAIDITGWDTYADAEGGYSVQYPNRGTPTVKHAVPPAITTILGWVGVDDYDLAIDVSKPGSIFNPNNLSFREWLAWYGVTSPPAQDILLNKATWVVVNEPATEGQGGDLVAFREEDANHSSTIYSVRFTCWTDPCPPVFWRGVLYSFRILPQQG